MKKTFSTLICLGLMFTQAGCSLSLLGTPIPLSTGIIPSTPPIHTTPTLVVHPPLGQTPTMDLPTITPINPAAPTITSTGTFISTTGELIPGAPSGPYGVILLAPGEELNIHNGPGTDYPVSGSFPSTATNIMRNGPSALEAGDLWVQVQDSSAGVGWVNSAFLTEYVAEAQFCLDSRVNSLIDNLGNALSTSDGGILSSLVSPAHGMTIYLWRNGTSHTFKQSDARWLFESTYEHDWGSAPASGLDTVGAFHEVVLPKLSEVFISNHTLTCDSPGAATQYGTNPWPLEYKNVNFYTVYKPGTPGVDLDFRYWLVGVEYVQSQPYVFALIHFAWEP